MVWVVGENFAQAFFGGTPGSGQNPHFNIAIQCPEYSHGPSGFLPIAKVVMSFWISLFSKEKGIFEFLGAVSPSKSPNKKSTKGPLF